MVCAFKKLNRKVLEKLNRELELQECTMIQSQKHVHFQLLTYFIQLATTQMEQDQVPSVSFLCSPQEILASDTN